jgi:pilus assembly protein CpaF
LQEVPGVSLGERSLLVAVKNIARRLGDDISEVKPILDSRLPDGSRVAAVIPPCSLGGITLTIRKFSSRLFEMEDLIRAGALDRALANRLEDYVLSRKNLLISGGTGAGKTTLAASPCLWFSTGLPSSISDPAMNTSSHVLLGSSEIAAATVVGNPAAIPPNFRRCYAGMHARHHGKATY